MKYSDVTLKKPKKVSSFSWKYAIAAVLTVVGVAWFLFQGKIVNSADAVSIITGASVNNLKEYDGRINVLVLGSDKRSVGYVDSVLTDTILVASIGKLDKDVVMISIPRDLWVQTSKGYQMKINEVYTTMGIEELKTVLHNVLGINLAYHSVVNFEMFKDIVDLLGGVEITVDNAFTDYYYPIEGKENAPENERYEIVHFDAGKQTLNGEQALKFSRSRHGDNNEGTDFARARRQQKVIMAIKEKTLSIQTLINPAKIKELYDIYSNNVDTNVDLATLQNFYVLSQEINFDRIVSVVLDDSSDANNGGLLYAPQDTALYGGRYVLIPKTGDYSQIHAYVQKYLFSGK